jgi:transcriptional regulator with XRE-family HTH domain
MNIAKELKQDRINKGLTQAEFAKKIGVSQQAIAKLEAGSEPRPGHMVKILKVLGTKSLTYSVWQGNQMQVKTDLNETLLQALVLINNQQKIIDGKE